MKRIATSSLAGILASIAWPVLAQAHIDVLCAAGMGQLMTAKADCLFSGVAALNLKQVRYSLYALEGEPVDWDDWADRSGWHEIKARVPSLVGMEGILRIRLFESGSRRLIFLSNPQKPLWLAAACFESADIFRETLGDAPGRDPGGWPKPAIYRRILHAAAGGFEAAWYRTAGSPATVMARVKASLGADGWETVLIGETALTASRRESEDIAVFAGRDEQDGYLLVTSITERR